MNDNYVIKNKSIEKALKVLDCFSTKSQLGVVEIAQMLDLNKSNVHDILTTLAAFDYVQKNKESNKYQLGIGIFTLSRALGDNFSITKVAMPYLQELANITKERVYLGVGYSDEVLYLDAFYPTDSIDLMRSLLGVRAKMFATAIGKSIMSYLPEEIIDQYIQAPLEKFTENTITDRVLLKKELQQIKYQGYAIDNMEHEFGIKCVGVPIIGKDGIVVGALSVSGPSLRFDKNRLPEIINVAKEYAKKIERRIL